MTSNLTTKMSHNLIFIACECFGIVFLFQTAFWQTRLENSTKIPSTCKTNPNVTKNLPPLEPNAVACFRWPGRDPIKTQCKTMLWRLVKRPEANMVGIEHELGGDPFDEDLIACNASHWLFNNTNITKKGDVLPGLLGYEVDGIRSDKTTQGCTMQKGF